MYDKKPKDRIAFVILHYLSAELTINCIDSILELGNHSAKFEPCVVVVDNASGNGSAEEVECRYCDNDTVVLLHNEKNEGFSRANNRGYRYALDTFSPKHVVIMNNDTVVEQGDFLDCTEVIFQREGHPFVIGPDIFVARKGFHQNPSQPAPQTREQVERRLNRHKYLRDHNGATPGALGKVRFIMTRLAVGRRLLNRRDLKRRQSFEGWKKPANGSMLHGAALIFTTSFIETDELPFYPETFLYEEEQILALRCERREWKTYYTPELQIIHFDDGSTDALTNDYDRKVHFVSKNEVESLSLLLSKWDDI